MRNLRKIKKSDPTLFRIVIERRKDGYYDVTRERKDNGERMTGARTLREALEYVEIYLKLYCPDVLKTRKTRQRALKEFEQLEMPL